ncbi:hypothetical protein ACODT3_40045 [Streptomyces sp. 4.24]|uniref:hypothetical protein n=1 Tax=Streptomyces tritrimontium TaxID=3406573 RepID=UPI003BB5F667
MKTSLVANTALSEVRAASGEFALPYVLLFGCFLVLAGLVALAMVLGFQRLGVSPPVTPPTPRGPAVVPSGSQGSMRRWTIAGVVVGAICAVITAVGVVNGW